MKKIHVILFLFSSVSMIFGFGQVESQDMESRVEGDYTLADVDTAVFAGGCFWGVEGVFELLNGVEDVVSGYAGGAADTAHYRMVGTGQTGHAETVQILYDPNVISFEKLLEVFFIVAHDPTQLNYQGPDIGTEYRSSVFYMNEEQKMKTEAYIQDMEKEGVYKQQIVTQLEELEKFYPAEDYHQDFLTLNPTHPYIVYWDMPKIRDLENRYPELLADK